MPFQPGQSGNPSGRPPRIVEQAQRDLLLKLYDEKAETAVIRNMIAKAKSRNDSQAVAAATWLDERKYGKLKERLEHSGHVDVSNLSDDELRAILTGASGG